MTRRSPRARRACRLSPIHLVTTHAGGPMLVPGLTLHAQSDGLTVISPTGWVVRAAPWAEVHAVVPGASVQEPNGTLRRLLDVRIGERRHRFLAPAAAVAPFVREVASLRDDSRPHRSLGIRMVSSLGLRPRHAPRRWLRISPTTACLTALALVLGGATLGSLTTGGALAVNGAASGTHRAGLQSSIMGRMANAERAMHTLTLPAASAPPAPAPPSLAGAPPLRPHEIFGFAPYWTLPDSPHFDVAGLTTLAYFSVDANADGTVDEHGPGWVGYQSQALADLVTRAHQASDRVVLTVTSFDQPTLDELTADPAAPGRLSAALTALVSAKNLDGVNLDFEGNGPKDQAGLDRLVAQVSGALHQHDPHWQVTMDTYASSAGDRTGFYDIAGLAPSVDGFFVMAYDMDDPSTPSSNAPLTGARFNDLDAVQQYTAVVDPAKVILGVPYYGYDWPTAGPGQGDPATGPPTPMSDAQIAQMGGPRVYWDPTTATAWTSYLQGAQWHQVWFDDATSLALKARLAANDHLGGLGIWALGMEGSNPALLAGLLGNAPPLKDLPGPGPTVPPTATTTTTVPPGPPFHYLGAWNGATYGLVAIDPAKVPGAGLGAPAGQLSAFSTDDPVRACLASGSPLRVSALNGSPGTYVVTASPPADCTLATWEFTVPAPTPTTSPPTTGPPTSTTTTTGASPTSTTTTTSPTTTTTG
ncbi:MAG TPA: glycosyl hydrolase family 18 protein [Acidimicrobiales bacterium]|nr:glycosyl hydrolase family 18 protein [Acidimicrobiales bacterium]